MQLISWLVFSSLVATATSVLLATYSDCGSHADIHSISMEPCDAEPCGIIPGVRYTTHINFTSTEESKTATNVCHGIIEDIPVPFEVKPDDACGNGVECPILPGVSQIYTASVRCPEDVAPMRLVAQWQVQDDHGEDIICFNFPLSIVPVPGEE